MLIKQLKKGFTLVELAVVLLIVSILLGYTLGMVPVQQELKQYNQAKQEMNQIVESLYAFAQVQGYLPCPAVLDGANTSNGFECRSTTDDGGNCDSLDASVAQSHSCSAWIGLVPAKTLGIEGRYSVNGILVDPWGRPYRYQVSNTDSGGAAEADFVFEDEMRQASMGNLTPDLSVCNADPSPAIDGVDATCVAAITIISNAPAVVLSLGKNRAATADDGASQSELENIDNSVNDRVFVFSNVSEDNDDLVKWVSPNILYSKMIESGQLP